MRFSFYFKISMCRKPLSETVRNIVRVRADGQHQPESHPSCLCGTTRTDEGWLDHLRKTPPDVFLSFVRLFFDGYKESTTAVQTILSYDQK